jgi:hypothetical protein
MIEADYIVTMLHGTAGRVSTYSVQLVLPPWVTTTELINHANGSLVLMTAHSGHRLQCCINAPESQIGVATYSTIHSAVGYSH